MARGGQLTVRLTEHVLERLERRSQELGQPKSRVTERILDEGLRVEEFPGIVFRDGPTGRRAGLIDGPDIWEVIGDVKRAQQRSGDPIAVVMSGTNLSDAQVRIALAYYGSYPEEIDARIARNEELHEAAERALLSTTGTRA